jgi:hypothetical protein
MTLFADVGHHNQCETGLRWGLLGFLWDPGTAENGIYVLCYCYETATQKCDQLEQFKAGVARFL